MNGHLNPEQASAELAIAQQIDDICDAFEKAWQSGKRPKLIEWVQSFEVGHRHDLLQELIPLDIYYRRQAGEQPRGEDYQRQFPTISLALLETALRSMTDRVAKVSQADSIDTRTFDPNATKNRPPAELTTTQSHALEATSEDQRIGRFRLIRLLGQGAFGRVWLGFDDELQRHVAIKVPTPDRFQRPEDAEAYLAEARTVAGLDHPNIVPVHDVGRSADSSIYVVSKFIEGCNLAERIKQGRLPGAETAKLLATVAQALHHAHQKRLIHRDIKPANILIEERTGKPYVADFGLAISEEDYLRAGKMAGTPAYMSPEQARGEGHRLDGRSDIFSTGVVLYEMLTGRRPFRGGTTLELFHQIISVDPAPPRELVGSIPAELERICLKALSKRASDRYATAAELADDLAHSHQRPLRDQKELQIVPKGLRSFDADAAEFFLELLPGPRNRDGLPESIQFWKTRLEETDPDQTFRVGLIYGPSGCGKSSLVKAGLLPGLSKDVIAVYLEATPDDTEIRILRGLRKCLPDLPHDLGLVATLAALRRREGPKVVILLDQFEQWLYAHKAGQETELVNALRQCDGGHVQAVVMVRDDFWLAASRFMNDVEVELLQGQNIALVDLFDTDHAQKVLTKFGQAFGKLPAQLENLPADEKAFLSSVAQGLAQDGKVVSVQLSLFAEMVKGKPWILATLEQVGGTAGVGVNFLEETFNSRMANPQHRLHQEAARAVLKCLLPEVGSDIKGHMRSHTELLNASGYQDRPSNFNELLCILDGELRLITPTDSEGFQSSSASDQNSKYYQLTHDYLVPSLREWLTRKQRETRRGRAELRLAERSALWNVKPENQQLPSLGEFLSIRLWTNAKHWSDPEWKMMDRARRVQGIRSGIVVAVLIVASVTGLSIRNVVVEKQNTTRAQGLVEGLLNADIGQVPALVSSLEGYRTWADPLLKSAFADAEKDSSQRLNAALALLPVDVGQVNYLQDQQFVVTPQQFLVVRNALLPHKGAISEKLWGLLQDRTADQDVRLRAASALALYTPDDLRWEKVSDDVTARLVMQNSLVLGTWADALKPIARFLLPSLASFLADEKRAASERGVIANIYNTYSQNQPDAFARLENVLAEKVAETSTEMSVARLKHQANVGVALLLMGRGEKVWPLLRHSPDPTLRSFLIDRPAPSGIEAKVLMDRLERETDTSVRRAILLSLGNLGEDRLSAMERQNYRSQLLQLYRNDPDPGIHGAAEWLLRRWQAVDSVLEIDKSLATGKVEGERLWYINRQGQTMAIVSEPGEFWMGEEPDEFMVGPSKKPHKMQIDRSFSIGTKEVTAEQFGRFRKAADVGTTESDKPATSLSWYDAVAYCNWLSEQERIPQDQWCYLPNVEGKYAAGMEMAENYLQRTGYRLPSEAEWEFACRAGSETRCSFGNAVELLDRYAWYAKNSPNQTTASLVGRLKPNDLGLFDMHGNLIEWAQNKATSATYMKTADGKVIDYAQMFTQKDKDTSSTLMKKIDEMATYDTEDMSVPKDETNRAARGGSFNSPAYFVRSASGGGYDPKYRSNTDCTLGFRLARTIPTDPFNP